MSYCPKCGVELEITTINCPLCNCEIPHFDDEINENTSDKMFPVPENLHRQKTSELKKQAFLSITILCIGAIITLLCVHFLMKTENRPILYGVTGILGAWCYIFILFGYISHRFISIISIGVVSLFLVLCIDIINPGLSWSVRVAWPVIILLTFIVLLAIKLYLKFRHRNQYVIIPIYIFLWSAFFCIVLECILDYNFSNKIFLSWSLIVLISLLSIAGALFALYVNLPEKNREKIRRKLHI